MSRDIVVRNVSKPTAQHICLGLTLLYLDLFGSGIGIAVGIEIEKSIAIPIPIPMPSMILTLGRDQPPLRGPRPIKPPALPEDTYSAGIFPGSAGEAAKV